MSHLQLAAHTSLVEHHLVGIGLPAEPQGGHAAADRLDGRVPVSVPVGRTGEIRPLQDLVSGDGVPLEIGREALVAVQRDRMPLIPAIRPADEPPAAGLRGVDRHLGSLLVASRSRDGSASRWTDRQGEREPLDLYLAEIGREGIVGLPPRDHVPAAPVIAPADELVPIRRYSLYVLGRADPFQVAPGLRDRRSAACRGDGDEAGEYLVILLGHPQHPVIVREHLPAPVQVVRREGDELAARASQGKRPGGHHRTPAALGQVKLRRAVIDG